MPEIDEASLGRDLGRGLDPSATLTNDIALTGSRGRVQVASQLMTDHLATPDGPARVVVRSVTPLPGLTCDDVDDLLEPTAWQDLSAGRLRLRPVEGAVVGNGRLVPDGPPRRYRETFLLAPGLVLRPVLTCVRRTLGGAEQGEGRSRGRSLEYRLTPHEDGLDQSRMVVVDQGSVVVHELPHGLIIRTTKRLRFTPPFDGPAFSATADLAGYDEANAAMIQAALHRAGDRAAAAAEIATAALATLLADGERAAPIVPGRPIAPPAPSTLTGSVAARGGPTPSEPLPELTAEQFGAHLVERFVGQGAAATAVWWTGAASAWTQSFGLALRGSYSTEQLKSDWDAAWSRYVGMVSSWMGSGAYAPGPGRGTAESDQVEVVPRGRV